LDFAETGFYGFSGRGYLALVPRRPRTKFAYNAEFGRKGLLAKGSIYMGEGEEHDGDIILPSLLIRLCYQRFSHFYEIASIF
jgi:hypothetical protein